MNYRKFQQIIWSYYKENKRDLPWRHTRDPYKILVSEIMLQQTQVSRVIPKYEAFIKRFPTVHDLAKAKLSEVLKEWVGLGYNRRALYFKKCAEIISKEYNGKFPKDFNTLCSLPGIGPATAGDLMLFAWNVPTPVIETNIRAIFIHFFFPNKEKVTDKELLPLIEKTMDTKNPREWYWALFDYGAFLKKNANPGRKSAHHVKQSKFIGSYRQKRAAVLQAVLTGISTVQKISSHTRYEQDLVSGVLSDLVREGFIREKNNRYSIT